MKRFCYLWVTCILGIASVLVACSPGAQDELGEPPAETRMPDAAGLPALVHASVERREGLDVRAGEVAALVEANNAFATELYRIAASESEDNLIFSPYSIALAFSMAYAGAQGETAAQMQEVLHFLEQAQQHRAFNGLERYLNGLDAGQAEDENTGQAFQMEVANALWGQQGAPFQEPFLQTLAAEYGAGLQTADFAGNAEAARQAINTWVENATKGRIQDLVAPGTLDAKTQLVLANAIYFYGAWLQAFQESSTEVGPFTLLDGTTVMVPLMHESTARVPYTEAEGVRAVQLPYTGQKVDMLVILPGEGRFEEVQQQLDAEFLKHLRTASETRDVTVTLPKFQFESDLDLRQLLPKMGLTRPFGGEADFSGILAGGGLYVDAARHKAAISVDEKGTEATAATEIAMAVSEMPRGEFEATRPFMLAIVERETGAVLFLGRIVNPS